MNEETRLPAKTVDQITDLIQTSLLRQNQLQQEILSGSADLVPELLEQAQQPLKFTLNQIQQRTDKEYHGERDEDVVNMKLNQAYGERTMEKNKDPVRPMNSKKEVPKKPYQTTEHQLTIVEAEKDDDTDYTWLIILLVAVVVAYVMYENNKRNAVPRNSQINSV